MNKKYKLFSWIGIAVAVVLFITLNIFMSVLSTKMPLNADLTTGQRYEITSATEDYLKEYTADTTIYILASITDEDKNVRPILEKYAALNSHIKLKNVDTTKDPGFGREYVQEGETLDVNSIIVTSGEKWLIIKNGELYQHDDNGTITALDVESRITSALKLVSGDNVFKAYFTGGHSEDEFTGAKEALQSENYETEELDSFAEKIPEDASVIIVACPKNDFSTAELARMEEYVRNGGAVEFFVNNKCPELPNINAFLNTYGIGITNEMIVETKSNTVNSGSNYMFIANYEKNDVSQQLIENNRVTGYLPYAMALETKSTSGAYTVEPYITSSSSAYITTNGKAVEQKGGLPIALLSTNSESDGKVFASGSDLLLSYSVSEINSVSLANAEYFTAFTDDITGYGRSFVVPVKNVGANFMLMNVTQKYIIIAITAVIIPMIFLVMGIAVFFKRRNM